MVQQTTLGKMLRRLRVERGLTTRAFAEKTGFSSAYISLLENDLRRPDAFTLGRILGRAGASRSKTKCAFEELARLQGGEPGTPPALRNISNTVWLASEWHAKKHEPAPRTVPDVGAIEDPAGPEVVEALQILRCEVTFRKLVTALVKMPVARRGQYLDIIEKMGALAANLPATPQREEKS